MDNVTHALAGALIGAAAITLAERRGKRDEARDGQTLSTGARTALTVSAVVAAELPDADLLYAGPMLDMGKLGYLLHHRGHTHTVLFALAAAVLVWGAVLALRREMRTPQLTWTLLGAVTVGTLSHLLLDFTNSYGVHPFWPVVNRWFYGDAVFIVEPWFWIIAIPPLFLRATGNITRGVLGLLLALILAAAWYIDMVGRGTAIALTLVAVVYWIVMQRTTAQRRVWYAIGAWTAVELLFFAAAVSARGAVRNATGPSYRDAVLNPAVSNPLCWTALVVERDGATYRSSRAFVSSVPSLSSGAACAGTARGGGASAPRDSVRAGTSAVQWAGSWNAPLAELQSLVSSNCEIAAAMQFVRVPAWERAGDTIRFYDQRYSDRAGGGFAAIETSARPVNCPRHVPGWTPPRADLLE